jgi:glutamate--cysteine ligase
LSGPTPDNAAARATIENRAQLISYFTDGFKPKSEWRIGTEHEKFPFYKSNLRPVPYEGETGIRALLEGMKNKYGWEGVYEGEHIIALSNPNGLDNISLEPGGQFELSGAPLSTVNETLAELNEHLLQAKTIGDQLGIGFLGLGGSPVWTRAETPIMPKGRYKIMAPYMDKVGTMGRDMMFRTCTVQVNLDYSDEADMVKKLRTSIALQPLATALFANSPFLQGKPNGYQSFRSHVWTDTDNARAGMTPFVFEKDMSIERYVDYALDVPMYFAMRDGKYLNTAGESFRKFLDGKLPQLPGEKPTMKDWADHLTTIFPEVRLKKYLEMRGADSGLVNKLAALPAFWVGLLYDQDALDAAYDLIIGSTAKQRQAMRNAVPTLGLNATFKGQRLASLAKQVLEIARKGLISRGFGEEQHLDILDEELEAGKTQAEVLLEKYKGEWQGDVSNVFAASAY